MRELHLDMDGVLVDLYSEDWRTAMANEDHTVFLEAKPLGDMDKVRRWLLDLRRESWRVVINTHTPDGASPDYHKRVELAKTVWLLEHLGWDCFDLFVCTAYGTDKSAFMVEQHEDSGIIDDSARNRQCFTDRGFAADDEQGMWDYLNERY